MPTQLYHFDIQIDVKGKESRRLTRSAQLSGNLGSALLSARDVLKKYELLYAIADRNRDRRVQKLFNWKQVKGNVLYCDFDLNYIPDINIMVKEVAKHHGVAVIVSKAPTEPVSIPVFVLTRDEYPKKNEKSMYITIQEKRDGPYFGPYVEIEDEDGDVDNTDDVPDRVRSTTCNALCACINHSLIMLLTRCAHYLSETYNLPWNLPLS